MKRQGRSSAPPLLAAAGALVLLGGCAAKAPVLDEKQVRVAVAEASNGKICRYERPSFSRVKQHICMTPQEASLRDMANEVLYRNSLVAMHGGRP